MRSDCAWRGRPWGIEQGAAGISAALIFILVACSGEAPKASSVPSSDARGAELELRIDGNEADLVPITWLGVSPAGQIALIQGQDRSVRFFDATGTSVGTVGRDGEGPGEFRRPLRGGWISDTLWISDTQLNRITLIGPAREVLGTLTPPMEVRVPATGDGEVRYGLNTPFGALSRNSLIVLSGTVEGAERDPGTGPPVLRVSTDGRLVKEVLRLPLDEGGRVSFQVEGGVAYLRVPFHARSEWSIAPDGELIAVLTHEVEDAGQQNFRVRAYDSEGGQRFDRRFPFQPVQIPAARMDSAIAANVERRPDSRRQVESALREAAPTTYPGAERLVIGQDHRVWVGLQPKEDGQTWLVLNNTGEPVDTVALPDRVTLHAASASHLWAVERDRFDVESVVRYRLARDAR